MNRWAVLSILMAGCTTTQWATPEPIPAEPGSLRHELVRYAGRMTVHAWIGDESNPVMQMRLDRETFTLPVTYHLGAERVFEMGPAAQIDARELAEAIDADYRREVVGAFERFWKTGPFTTPETIDRVHVLDDRIRGPGTHLLQIEVEPDTVSWSVTFRVVRETIGPENPAVLATLDLDSMMVPPVGGRRYPLPSVRFVR